MLEGIQFLDDATRPQAPEITGMKPEQRLAGQHLKMIHDHLRENMHVLRTLIDRAGEGQVSPEAVVDETAELTMIANYRNFGNLCGQHCQFVEMHHSIEDASIFPPLSEKGAAFRKVADRLRAEHVVVHELLMRLVDALETLAREPNKANFDGALTVYDALERVLLSHLGYEEDSIGDALGYFKIF